MKQLVWITTVRQQANRGLKCVTIKNYSCLKQTQTTFAGSVPGNLPSKSLKCRSQAAVPRANKEVTNAPAVHKGPTRAVCFLQPNVLPRSFHGSMRKRSQTCTLSFYKWIALIYNRGHQRTFQTRPVDTLTAPLRL